MSVIKYKPFAERTVDGQYHKLLKEIMDNGKTKIPIHASLPENAHLNHVDSKDITGYQLNYDLSNGFPLQTIRGFEKGFFGSLAEIHAFLNGARTLDELNKFGVPEFFWGPSVTKEKCAVFGLKEGDLGPGSYGAVLRNMPGPDGTYFDQIQALEEKIKKSPQARTLMVTTWDPRYALGDKSQGYPRSVVVAPCHGTDTLIKIYPDGDMHVHTTQRSADAPVGLIGNITQWCVFGMMIADLFDLNFTKYVYSLPDAQIYDIQYDKVTELLKREARKLPTVQLKPQVKRNHIWEYQPKDFILTDYNPHPGMRMDVTV
ncbi:MAG: thymidylate synthase [Candidatus Nomurabacteria bacterium]|nr:thymidylate synthase [Candidatus Nomurabacteria bacterium]